MRVVVVTGEHARARAVAGLVSGGAVIDREEIRRGFGSGPNAERLAHAAWCGALDRLRTLEATGTAWIVHPAPTPEQAAAYRARGYSVLPPSAVDDAFAASATAAREHDAVSGVRLRRAIVEAIGRHDDAVLTEPAGTA